MSTEIAELRDAHSTLGEARRCYAESVRNAFPVGCTVTSGKSGRGLVTCEVLKHAYDGQIFVRSQTGKEYWITAYWIKEAGLNDNL